MPVHITKISSGRYKVSTPSGTKAKGTTKTKAESQERLLRGIEHGWKPTNKKNKLLAILFILFVVFSSLNTISESVFVAYRSSKYILIKNMVFIK